MDPLPLRTHPEPPRGASGNSADSVFLRDIHHPSSVPTDPRVGGAVAGGGARGGVSSSGGGASAQPQHEDDDDVSNHDGEVKKWGTNL